MSETRPRPGTRMYAAPLVESPEEVAYELRSAEGATWTAGKLLVAIGAFFFAGLAFAYFYLRSANDANLWRPHGVTAPIDLGAAIFALVAGSAVLNVYGTIRLRKGQSADWEVSGWSALLGLLLAVSLQIWELTRLRFSPGSSGYSSVFIGWAGMNAGAILIAAYWLETLLARTARLRRAIREDGGPSSSPQPAARLLRANLESGTYFLGFVAFVNLLFWLLFYVVI